MKIEQDEEIPLTIKRTVDGEEEEYECSYIVVSYHRDNSLKNKSKWTIDEEEELNCFIQTQENMWIDDYTAWGIKYEFIEDKKISKTIIDPIGNSEHNEDLHIAKFVDSNENDTWHGYPADYRRKKQDIPPTNVLSAWMEAGILKKHQASKIKRGKKCNL